MWKVSKSKAAPGIGATGLMSHRPRHWRETNKRPSVCCRSCGPRARCPVIFHQVKGTTPKCVIHKECEGWQPDDRPAPAPPLLKEEK